MSTNTLADQPASYTLNCIPRFVNANHGLGQVYQHNGQRRPAVCRMAYATHPIAAAEGIVTIQAPSIVAPTPQPAAVRRRGAPAPITAPVRTCVVLTGQPKNVASWITAAPVSWAPIPIAGS